MNGPPLIVTSEKRPRVNLSAAGHLPRPGVACTRITGASPWVFGIAPTPLVMARPAIPANKTTRPTTNHVSIVLIPIYRCQPLERYTRSALIPTP